MLSFRLIKANNAVQIDCDDQGIAMLITAFEKLRGSGSHVHLRAPPHGGADLSDETPWGARAVGEVIISHGGD